MKLESVSPHCYAILPPSNRLCDANSGYICHPAGGLVIDTQSDLAHATRLAELIATVDPGPPRYVVNTHEDADHVWGNQIFAESEIIAHRTVPERMKLVADPRSIRRLTTAVKWFPLSSILKVWHPGLHAVGTQLGQDFNFDGIELTFPTTLFEDRFEIDLHGVAVHVIYLGPAHQVGDAVVHVPADGVVFTGDLLFSESTPMGWAGTHRNWIAALDHISDLQPQVLVPGHGPPCGLEGLTKMRSYLESMWDQSQRFFAQGLTAKEAAVRIDIGRFQDWNCPARVFMIVERNFRELRGESLDRPWNVPAVFDAIHDIARERGLPTDF